MKNTEKDIIRLKNEFSDCKNVLTAIGDETRLHVLLTMLGGPCGGKRVIEIAKDTNLSRPAVSHHIKILKDAGIVKMRKEGTFIYYLGSGDPNSHCLSTEFLQVFQLVGFDGRRPACTLPH